MPAYTERSWRFWYEELKTTNQITDEPFMENDSIFTLFKKPVMLYTGSKLKIIRYIELNVLAASYTPVEELAPAFEKIQPIGYQTAMNFGWDQASTDQFVVLKDPTICIRNSTVGVSCAVLGKEGVNRGFHHWKIYWDPLEYGIHPSVGICTKETTRESKKYEPLIGADLNSYGWHLRQNCLLHDFKNKKKNYCLAYPGFQFYSEDGKFKPLPEISILLDLETGTLGFRAGDTYLGHAFKNIPCGKEKFYPAVSCTWGHSKIQIRYVGGFYPHPDSLLSQSKRKISQTEINKLLSQLEFSPEFKELPSMPANETFEQKKLNFISEPIQQKGLLELCGVDKEVATQLQRAGFTDAAMVLGQFLLFLKDQETFVAWMREVGHASARQAEECFDCLNQWCQNFL